MEGVESQHIDEVFNQFSQLKLVIDTQSAIKQEYTPVVTSVILGTNRMPFFMSMPASGRLQIIPDSCIVTIRSSNFNGSKLLGTIRFTSSNSYYIPNEQISFIYENGAIITNQTTNSALNIKPSCQYNRSSNKIYFNLINISAVGGKIEKSGADIEHIRTEFYYNNSIDIEDVEYLTIRSHHPNIWSMYINSTLRDGGLVEGPIDGPADDDYLRDVTDSKVTFLFNTNKDTPDLELKITGIYAQIGPGWVETQ
jgi:hypothetical protein